MNSSQSSRDSEKIKALLAKARADLAMRGIIPSPQIEQKLDAIPDIVEPKRNQADIEKEFNELKARKAHELQIEQMKLREAKQQEYEDEKAKIEASRPKMEWNLEQSAAIDRAMNGDDFCLIGKAGTGKTTVTREFIREVVKSGRIGPINEGTKYLRTGLPGIAVVSFTNRAVKNIEKGMAGDMKPHCLTVHKLLEFRPVPIVITAADGTVKNSMRFLPSRNSLNPLPKSLRCIIFEESSMISTELFALLMDALPGPVQMIFLGDLQQLPPVYGTAILGYKLLDLPVVELTKIYRQAEGSPIIGLAWDIASGKDIKAKDYPDITKNSHGKITIRPWKKRLESFAALHIMNGLFKQFIDSKVYDPNEDMIMIPFNKSFGTLDFNQNLAQYLGRKREATVFQIIAGFTKHYFAVGDKVLVERQEAIIEEIIHNDMYRGVIPLSPAKNLNRWGLYETDAKMDDGENKTQDLDEVEQFMLQQIAKEPDDEEAKQQASHILVCRLLDSDEIKEVRTTGEYSSCLFAYALTVHKCQGSEWRKCFLLLHHSHATMINRELLYTAVTRAREELVIICEPDTFEKGIKTQRIRGNTIKEKAEFFKGKLEKEL